MSSEDTQYKNNVGNGLRKETKVLRNSSKAGQISKKKKKDIEFEAKELGRPLTPLTRGNLGFLPHNHLIWGITAFPGYFLPWQKEHRSGNRFLGLVLIDLRSGIW